MEVAQFVNEDELDPEYFEKPYFVVPENDVADRSLRSPSAKPCIDTKKIAHHKIAFGGREHIVAIDRRQPAAPTTHPAA